MAGDPFMKLNPTPNRPATFSLATLAEPMRPARVRAALDENAVQLFLLAALSLAIYVLAFVRPYSLFEWWTVPHLDISKIARWDTRAALGYLLAMFTLFGLYWLAVGRARGRHRALAWGIVIAGAIAFCAALLFLYPVDAVDIFDNIIRGRMQTLYGANPFYQVPNGFRQDPFYPYAGWYTITSAYGPGWELLSRVLAGLAGNGIIANVIVYKLLNIFAFGGITLLIGLLLQKYAPERALYGVVLFAWNPLVLYTAVGNGHNDVVMVFFIVLAFYLVARGHFTWAALAMTAGALIKFIPILLLPLILFAAIKRLKDWRARLSFLLLTGGACQILIVGSIIPYWHGGDMISVTRRGEMFTTSLPTWLVIGLERFGHQSAYMAELLASRAALVVLGLWVLYELWKVWRQDNGETPEVNWQPYVRAGLSILMFYLLVSCLWFQSWYVVWAIALAALVPESLTTRGAVLLSLAAIWKMPLFDFVIHRNGYLPPFQTRELPLTAGTLGAVWFYFVYQWSQVPPPQVKAAHVEHIQPRENATE